MQMLSKSILLPLLTVLLWTCQSSHSISLVNGGNSDYTITLAENADDLEVKAAEALKDYLHQISGVNLAISKEESPGKKILIGQWQEAAAQQGAVCALGGGLSGSRQARRAGEDRP